MSDGRCRVAWALGAALIGCGCVEHRATIAPDPDHGLRVVTPGGHHHLLAEPLVVADALPVELVATGWTTGAGGELLRADLRVASPRRWWQRFPFDLVSDLLIPATITAQRGAVLDAEAVVPVPAADLRQAAIDAGYAGRAGMMAGDVHAPE